MPRPVNKVQIMGNLTKDPQIVVTAKGDKTLKIANFSIVYDWWGGKKLNPPWYFDCVAFSYAADNAEKFLKKGTKILVTDGAIKPEVYKKKDGTTAKTIRVIVNDFIMVGLNKKSEGVDYDTAIEQEVSDIDDIPY